MLLKQARILTRKLIRTLQVALMLTGGQGALLWSLSVKEIL
jgi:hypothetical protein